MDRFTEMTAFVEVVKAGSFVQGADQLEMSKAAISRHVANLESRLGVQLLQRTTRRLSLTEEGQRFYERCQDVLSALESAESEAMTRGKEVSGTLRVNAPLTFGVLHLALVWGAFKKAHPKVILDVTLGDRMVDLVNDGYDLAIRISQLPDSSLVSKRLATTRVVLCASPSYLRAHGTPKHPRDLAHHAFIAYSYWPVGDELRFEGPEGPESVRVHPTMYTNNGDTCREAALAGEGIILQPTFLIGHDLRARKLVELMPRYRSIELGVYAVYPSRRNLLPRVRALVDFLAAHFQKPRWPEAASS